MARDHRIIGANGQRLSFTCENRGYRTNINKGESHSPMSENRGSVFLAPLVSHGSGSLWLEHVEEIGSAGEVYWLMWYGPDGRPTIPLSGVFDRVQLSTMVGQLASFVP